MLAGIAEVRGGFIHARGAFGYLMAIVSYLILLVITFLSNYAAQRVVKRFEFKLHLVEQPYLALAARAVHRTSQLLDRQPLVDNQRRGVGGIGTCLRKLGRLQTQQLLQGRGIVGERIISAHWP